MCGIEQKYTRYSGYHSVDEVCQVPDKDKWRKVLFICHDVS